MNNSCADVIYRKADELTVKITAAVVHIATLT